MSLETRGSHITIEANLWDWSKIDQMSLRLLEKFLDNFGLSSFERRKAILSEFPKIRKDRDWFGARSMSLALPLGFEFTLSEVLSKKLFQDQDGNLVSQDGSSTSPKVDTFPYIAVTVPRILPNAGRFLREIESFFKEETKGELNIVDVRRRRLFKSRKYYGFVVAEIGGVEVSCGKGLRNVRVPKLAGDVQQTVEGPI